MQCHCAAPAPASLVHASQVVCVGVYLLTPSKRAYLRYYKDLEDDILGRRGHAAADVESLMPSRVDQKFALANGTVLDDMDEVGSVVPAA